MPIPKPTKKEGQKEFMPRCIGDETMRKDFKDIKQRIAVCLTTYRDTKGLPKYKKKDGEA